MLPGHSSGGHAPDADTEEPRADFRRWQYAALSGLIIGFYLLLHPYLGIVHDARLYTIQALGHMHPELFSQDIFLKFGSQDRYTFFTPIYARLADLLGIERAASLLTFGSQMIFMISAWYLARVAMPPRHALAALGLLVILPGYYGSEHIFCFLEGFVTPRALAESLVLLAVGAWLRKRQAVAAVLIGAALLVHPIISLAGVTLLFMLWLLSVPHSKLWLIALAAAIGLPAGAALTGWIPLGHWQFDPQWLQIVLRRAPYLMLGSWSASDWANVATTVLTLTLAWITLEGPAGRLALAMLITTTVLMALTWIGADRLHIVTFVQGQAWRCLWLASVVAILMLPLIAQALWYGPALRRCGLVLLVAAWIMGSETYSPFIALLALLAISAKNLPVSISIGRMIFWSALALLGMALVWSFANTRLFFGVVYFRTTGPDWLDKLRGACENGVIPFLLLAGCWWAISRSRSRPALLALTATSLALPAAIAAPCASMWTSEYYAAAAQHLFEDWRAVIPPGTDVLWSENPVASWLLLQRPSFISSAQTATSLFSRPAALELDHRADSLSTLIPPDEFLSWGQSQLAQRERISARIPSLQSVCQASSVRFIITSIAIPDSEPRSLPPSTRSPYKGLKLYSCPQTHS